MKEKDKQKSIIKGKSHTRGGAQKMNAQNFANQNKTSTNDSRENIGAIGTAVSRSRPNAGPSGAGNLSGQQGAAKKK